MRKIAFVLIISSLLIISYSGFNIYQANQPIEEYKSSSKPKQMKKDINKKDIKQKKKMSDEITEYESGEEVANLKIPKLDKQFTTYWGTDDDALDHGVGMYTSEWTVTPDQEGHVVLSGHRDTVFAGMDELKDGDIIELEYDDKLYEYEIETSWITDPDDRSVIVDKDDPTLTLTTCYPFDFVGSAPERYIIQAKQK